MSLDQPLLPIKLLSESAKMPTLGTAGAAAFDAYADSEHVIMDGAWRLVKLGFAVEVPVGHALLVVPRSGLAMKQGITLLNSPGVIDSDYRGEVGAVVMNMSHVPFAIKKGDRIAQVMLVQVPQPRFMAVDTLTETARGAGGFGSTGTR